MLQEFTIDGQIVDVIARRIFPGRLIVRDGRIADITELTKAPDRYITPGLVDAHVHIESSMLIPGEFARLAVVHGTVATVSDPHEIGNVLGTAGVDYMLENARKTPFKFYFGAPSCVPATAFETAGAAITPEEVAELLDREEIKYLSEMMNFPGVLNEDPDVIAKIKAAQDRNKPVDGHAPGLRGDDARRYIEAGISTDHECFTLEEALDKLQHGMKIAIREGSAAKNFEALWQLIDSHTDNIMLCSDDKHPDDLVRGHINDLLRRAVAKGCDPMNALITATANPVKHYNLEVGLLQKGDPADFVIFDNLIDFNASETYLSGDKVAEQGRTLLESVDATIVNNFDCKSVTAADLKFSVEGDTLNVIVAEDGQLVTKTDTAPAYRCDDNLVSNVENDTLKLLVVNRYKPSEPAFAFIRGFGLKRGAIASSVAHDSHNIIAVGVEDEDLAAAVNLIIEARGGVSLSDGNTQKINELPVAGLMSPADGYEVARCYETLDRAAKQLGSALTSPYMTLSFMALLVIPELKLSDRGLFDGNNFRFIATVR